MRFPAACQLPLTSTIASRGQWPHYLTEIGHLAEQEGCGTTLQIRCGANSPAVPLFLNARQVTLKKKISAYESDPQTPNF